MRDKRMMARATQGLAFIASSLGVGGVTWIVARSLGMHGASGGILWSGGLLVVALGAGGSLSALSSLDTQDEQARGRALAALVLCPLGVFTSAFLIAVGQGVVAAH